jgi:ApaG protein
MSRPDHHVTVQVESEYIEGQSQPDQERYVFAYHVRIRNDGAKPAQLLSRHWIITDANGQVQEVRGEGVVGKQPRLEPDEEFSYSSGTVLATSVGTMRGSYHMVDGEGTPFEAEIPTFTLSVPRTLH